MEQNGEQVTDPHKYSSLIFSKMPRQLNEERIVFPTNDVEQLNIHIPKERTNEKN